MTRESERKKRWSAYISAKLDEKGMSAADLARATELSDATVSNWKVARAGISSEAAFLVAAAMDLDVSEVLEHAGYPILARAMAGKELRLVDRVTQKPDPAIAKIMARNDIPDDVKASLIQWWKQRLEDDETRRLNDMDRMIDLQTDRKRA